MAGFSFTVSSSALFQYGDTSSGTFRMKSRGIELRANPTIQTALSLFKRFRPMLRTSYLADIF